ncbi:MAG: hypothetical protein HRT77_09120 [Halioglobus sp.]|nr:hypothetical protein [Halioglobus sp.]
MKIIGKAVAYCLLGFLVLLVAFNLWGYLTLGNLTPIMPGQLADSANRVVMVFGATGSVGDGLLKAAIEAPEVEKVYVVTRRSSPRIDAGVASGKVEMHLQEDFTDYSELADTLAEVDTVLWGLGTTSIGMDDATYTKIHVDFPLAFVSQWMVARKDINRPMSFHFVTGMGTDPQGSQHWAREKGRTELALAALAEGTNLRSFSYRSGFVRPTSEQSNTAIYIAEKLLRPGKLVITGKQLGEAMLEISARTREVPNGTLIDNGDSIAFAEAYEQR